MTTNDRREGDLSPRRESSIAQGVAGLSTGIPQRYTFERPVALPPLEVSNQRTDRSPPPVSDAALSRQVVNRLTADQRLAPAHIGVSVNKRVVRLAGTVGSRRKKRLAEMHAAQVPGIRHIESDLEVKQRPANG